MAHWIIVADASEARAYVESARQRPLELARQWDNPEGRQLSRTVYSDRPERVSKAGSPATRSAICSGDSTHDHIVERFVRSLVADLQHEFAIGNFTSLSLVGPAYLLNEMRPLLGRTLEHRLKGVLVKNLVKCDPRLMRSQLDELQTPAALSHDMPYLRGVDSISTIS